MQPRKPCAAGAGQPGSGQVESGGACTSRALLPAHGTNCLVKKERPTLDNIGQASTVKHRVDVAANSGRKDAHTDIDSCESVCASANALGPCIHRGQSMSGAGDDLLQKDTNLNVTRR